VLPVSRVRLAAREPTGADELFLVETDLAPLAALLALVQRVTSSPDRTAVDWLELPAVDLEAAALLIRSAWLGDTIRTEARCRGDRCGEPVDVSFGIAAYLAHHRPRRPAHVRMDTDGWFVLDGASCRFRIPTGFDVLAAMSAAEPIAALGERCTDGELSHGLARRVDRALGALAPRLYGEVGGVCPACGATLTLSFDPVAYTLAELRGVFASVQFDTHVLATAYGWSEATILALPRSRRRRYAALIDRERVAA
jgi:hypothetical protein